jgi:hypothetical protein
MGAIKSYYQVVLKDDSGEWYLQGRVFTARPDAFVYASTIPEARHAFIVRWDGDARQALKRVGYLTAAIEKGDSHESNASLGEGRNNRG